MKLRRTILAGGVAIAATTSAGPSLAQDKPIRISVIQALTAVEWHPEIVQGAENAAADLDFPIEIKVVGPNNFDPGRQATMFQQEAATRPDALIVVDVAPALFIEPALQAEASGIKVVWMNAAPAPEFAKSLFVSADPAQIGATAAESLTEALEAKLGRARADIEGDIVVGLCVPGLSVLENRVAGFRATINLIMPKVKVSDTITTKVDKEGAFISWSQAIQANPDAIAYVDPCETGAEATLRIIEDDNLDALTVAMDGPTDLRDGAKRGTVTAVVNSDFYVQAYVSTYLTAKAIHDGTPLPEGWVKIVPRPKGKDGLIDSYDEAYTHPDTGLREFHRPDIDAAIAAAASGDLADTATYDTPEID